jgi:hypothetical protein
MFVMILSMGIGNLLGGLAVAVNQRSAFKTSRIHTGWLILVLLIHFNLFWQALEILSIEEWEFGSFLFVVTGPIILFLAVSIILPDPSEESNDGNEYYFAVAPQFFLLMAILQLWTIGVDLFVGNSLGLDSALSGVAATLLFLLSATRHHGLHNVGLAVAFCVFVLFTVLRGLGFLG